MVRPNDLQSMLDKRFGKIKILSAYSTPKKYIVGIKPVNMKEEIVDNLYSINKLNNKIEEYSPFENKKEYIEAMKHPVILK